MFCCSDNLLGRTMISSMMFNLDFLTILDEDDDEIFKKKELKENVIEAHFYMTDELHLLYSSSVPFEF